MTDEHQPREHVFQELMMRNDCKVPKPFQDSTKNRREGTFFRRMTVKNKEKCLHIVLKTESGLLKMQK